MEIIWFCLTAALIAGYVILDGFDLGAGIVNLFVSRDAEERKTVLRTIGPVWDGNEVWLLAAGGTLFCAFPAVYASSFAGFYLPLMIVLWLLILRGISIEFRNHLDSPTWTPLWDVVFGGASALLTIFYGAALGNVVRGVPLDGEGEFFLPLWTDFSTGGEVGILDWYTILVGVLAFFALAMHGALWVRLKTEGELHKRAGGLVVSALAGTVLLTVGVTAATFRIQPQILANFATHPWGVAFPAAALTGLLGVWRYRGRCERGAFLSSSVYLGGMLASAAFGVFPYMLPSNVDAAAGLTVYNSAAGSYGLRGALVWWIPGMLLALGYTAYVYRSFAGKVRPE